MHSSEPWGGQGMKLLTVFFISGYIVSRVKLAGVKAPIFKQLKWYEGRQEHILDVVLDPLGEWLACACLSGDLYLVPILSLMTVCILFFLTRLISITVNMSF